MAKGKRKNQPGKLGKTKANETESASAESLRSALISEMKSIGWVVRFDCVLCNLRFKLRRLFISYQRKCIMKENRIFTVI